MSERATIALVGLRCVGKSTLGPLLARALGVGFVDLDECVSYALQSDCCAAHAPELGAWIDAHGWPAFRELEARELARVLEDGQSRVLATGGGVVEREENRALLRRRARVVWLREGLDELARRAARDPSRPRLTELEPRAELDEVARRRTPLYAAVADVAVDCAGRSVEQLAQALAHELSAPRRAPPPQP